MRMHESTETTERWKAYKIIFHTCFHVYSASTAMVVVFLSSVVLDLLFLRLHCDTMSMKEN